MMDIPALSMAMSQASLMQDASLSVMKIAMDTAKVNAANMTEMLRQSNACNNPFSRTWEVTLTLGRRVFSECFH